METQSSKIIFFLGAGASVAAGVPDTYSFVQEFIDSLTNTEKKDTIQKIVEILEHWKGDKIDIELLLEALTKLKNKDEDPLLYFFEKKEFILDGYSAKEPLIDDLKDYIKSRAIVPEHKIQYLQPLLPLIEDFRPLDIISVNYDISIEQFCNVHKLSCQDGFDDHWNPKIFSKDHTDIRLYKLHGSVMWYQTNRGDYVKLPVMTGKNKIDLITGEEAENLMLYPMQKWDYAEPFLELSVEIKRLLELETCKFVISVGYSYRDKHIVRILWDAARKNRDLLVILIDPSAYQIYEKKLQYYDDQQRIPSSLNGKVICLPYFFEKVFPMLKNYYLKNLEVGLSCEKTQHQVEIQGEPPNFVYCLKHLVDAEYIEKAEDLLSRYPLDPVNFSNNNLEFPLRMAINLYAGNKNEKGSIFFQKFCEGFKTIAIMKLHIRLESAPKRSSNPFPNHQLEFEFNYSSNESGGSSYISGNDFIPFIEQQADFCQKRITLSKKNNENLQNVAGLLKKLLVYFSSFKEGKIFIDDYLNLRNDQIRDLPEITEFYGRIQSGRFTRPIMESLEDNLKEIERKILTQIIEDI